LLFDKNHLLRPLEMIALCGTIFRIISKRENNILEVTTKNYPSSYPLFIDSRFGVEVESVLERDIVQLPSPDLIFKRLKKAEGLPYVWGGNYGEGIPEMLAYYPPKKSLSSLEKTHWTFHGVDCSGLLYEATNGTTPRNTQDLIPFGMGVTIEGLSNEEIAAKMQPLDIVVWRGHMFIILDKDNVIESNHSYGGVTISPTLKRLNDITQGEGKKGVNDPSKALESKDFFVVRRLN